MTEKKILLIMAQTGFLYDGCLYEGYNVLHPYRSVNLFFRMLREFVFRFVPFLSFVFYNNEVLKGSYDYIFVWDPLITKRFIDSLHHSHPNAKIHFIYWNMVGKCSHLHPDQIPNYVTKWTYDGYDSKKYNLKYYTTYPYYKKYIRPHKSNDYDILFVGRDKGRGEYLLKLEKQMNDLGLKTKFIITKSSRLSKRQSYYQKELSYDEICDLVAKSRSVLNVIMENQQGITLRDLEYVFQGVKLITTNKAICDTPIYNPNNVFILGTDSFEELPQFLRKPMIDLPENVIKRHTLSAFVSEIIDS